MDPQDRKYTREHEWVSVGGTGTVRFGITQYAQEALGDIVYVSLPAVGAQLTAGEPCGEVESTKSVSDVYAPVSGTVLAVNVVLDSAPETVNADPYEAGWMVEVQTADSIDDLLDSAAYSDFVAGL
jgi:glycine cleavage system H protein